MTAVPYPPSRYRFRPALQTKMILLVSGLMIGLILVIGAIFSDFIATILENQIGRKALLVAESVASIPEVRKAILRDEPGGEVQEIAEEIRRKTGAEFVVVGDHEGRRLAHPNPEKIGRFMVGGDNRPALEEGQSYVSKAVGTLGPSIRGKTPVFTKDGKVIGVVSVGYLQEDVRAIIREAQLKTFPLLALVFLIGIGGAIMIARGLKEAIFGLEPEEIANLLQQRTAFLESMREGVVACNGDGRVSLVNTAALAQMRLASSREILERPVAEVLPEVGMEGVLESGVQRLDVELALGGHQMIFNLIPLRNDDQVNGVVATFRRKDEIDVLARELSSVRQYADMLRAQAHEHSNRLHTIAGLIQLESYDEALELIVSQETSFQELVGLLTRIAPDPILSALIIGKFNHALENDVELVLDSDSGRLEPPAEFDRNRLVTILGNLLDNACEAARTVESKPHRVRLQLGQTADELFFAVDDSGPGIPEDLGGRIFDKGVSGKDDANRGMGLFLVTRALKELGGRIEVESSELGGACFSVHIPKQMRR